MFPNATLFFFLRSHCIRQSLTALASALSAPQLTSLELLSEAVSAAMEEKDRDLKRARTVRADYARDVDAVTAWIERAELRVQDRSAEPHVLRDHLQQVQAEIGPTEDRLERLSRNARTIVESTRDEAEKARVQATVRTLADQLQQVRTWLHDKKQQVGATVVGCVHRETQSCCAVAEGCIMRIRLESLHSDFGVSNKKFKLLI